MNGLNAVLSVTLAGLAASLFASSWREDRLRVAERVQVFEDFRADRAHRIEIDGGDQLAMQKGNQNLVLERSADGEWGVRGADGYPAIRKRVETFLTAVENLAARGKVLEDEAYLAELSLADHNFQRRIRIAYDGGEGQIDFYVGKANAFQQAHIRKAGSNEVLFTRGVTSWEVGVTAGDWVDRTYLEVPGKQVTAITIERPREVIRLSRRPDGQWSVADVPPGRTAKGTTVAALAKRCEPVHLLQPVGTTEAPAHGLDRPIATVTLQLETAEGPRTVHYRIGTRTADGAGYYLKADSSPYVIISPYWGVTDLVEKSVVHMLEN